MKRCEGVVAKVGSRVRVATSAGLVASGLFLTGLGGALAFAGLDHGPGPDDGPWQDSSGGDNGPGPGNNGPTKPPTKEPPTKEPPTEEPPSLDPSPSGSAQPAPALVESATSTETPMPLAPIALPVIVLPVILPPVVVVPSLGLGGGGGGPGGPRGPATDAGPKSVNAQPQGGRRAEAVRGGDPGMPPATFRVGYVEYLRTAGTSQILALAVPGVAGILAITGAGGFVGYRQAKAGNADRVRGTARFMN